MSTLLTVSVGPFFCVMQHGKAGSCAWVKDFRLIYRRPVASIVNPIIEVDYTCYKSEGRKLDIF
jgi:hypothetical protein